MTIRRPLFILTIINIAAILSFSSCENKKKKDTESHLSIFFINDNHSQIDNFSKVKYIIDKAGQEGNILLVSSGDMFSGNPIVDFYEEKGYPVIDLMNSIGFDLATLGNHEFDYGQEILQDRIEQAEFDILCANMHSDSPLLEELPATATLTEENLKISFVGVVETNGMPGACMPSTHPSKLENLVFTDASQVLDQYSELKDETESDLLILLSHLGHYYQGEVTSDYSVAHDFPFFDLIIGGHSHSIQDTTINGVHIYQSGAYLHNLGKISLTVKNGEIISEDFELINLDDYPDKDEQINMKIEAYNNNPAFSEVIGSNSIYLTRNRTVGGFYTDALRGYLGTDMSFQNPGGIRSDLDEGDITILEIYRIDPFGNGLRKYEMTVAAIKDFLEGSGAGLYYSGVIIENDFAAGVVIKDEEGNIYPGDHVLSIAINDYIPTVYEDYFPDPVEVYDMITADAMIAWVRSLSEALSYDGCDRYFRYEE